MDIAAKVDDLVAIAIFFRDELQCQDALYFDGVVSSLYSVKLGRNDSRADLGPIIGVVQDDERLVRPARREGNSAMLVIVPAD